MWINPQKGQELSPSSTGMNTRRLEALSDGIFAIAITLLALNLQVPELTTITPQALAMALGAKWPTYLTFSLSFTTILITWVYHHHLLYWVRHAEKTLLFVNGILLLFISAVPFPTALLGAYLTTSAASVACAIYAGYIAALNFAFNLLWWVVIQQHRKNNSLHQHFPPSMILSFLGFPCYLIALGIAFWSPTATLIICGILWIVWASIVPRLVENMEPIGDETKEPIEKEI